MNIALIFAGGVGSRMGKTVLPKQFLEVDNKPIIIHVVEKFEKCTAIDYISIAVKEEYIPLLQDMIKNFNITKVKWISAGGETGQLSIFSGLKAIYEDDTIPRNANILVHDGVRPMIDENLILDNINMIQKNGNSITACPAFETVLYTDDKKTIADIISRDNILNAKAPQCFKLDELYETHVKAIKKEDINNWDSCSLMHKYGYLPHFTICKSSNIKITTIEDFEMYKVMYHMSK